MKTYIIHYGKFVIGRNLFKRPEKIIGGSHKQCAVLYRIFLIPAQWRGRVFLRYAVKPLDKCLEPGRDCPEVQWRGKNDHICIFYFGYKVVKTVPLYAGLTIAAGIASQASPHFIFQQGYYLRLMPGLLCTFYKIHDQL